MTTYELTKPRNATPARKYFLAVVLVLLALTLTGARQPFWNPLDFVIVDDDAGEWEKADFATIQGALDSGAAWIEVRPGTYTETLTIATEGVTVRSQGAVIPNAGNNTSIAINAPDVTLTGDLTIQGSNDGTGEGDFFQGVGVNITAPNATVQGLRTRDLRSFSVLIATSAAHHVILEDFDFRNLATDRDAQEYSPAAVMLINGTSYNTVRDGFISGHSQGIGTWYGSSHNTIEGNRLENNWGYQGAGAGLIPRSAIEDYGVPGAVNTANRFINNRIDGARSAGFELADLLIDTFVSGNEVRNVHAGFGVQGSEDNKGRNITIESNHFYGDGDGDDGTNWFSGSGTIRDNSFIDWRQDNIGTIYIPDGALGDVDITGNTFIRNGRVMRITASDVNFNRNRVSEPLYSDLIYIDAQAFDIAIEDNRFEGGAMAVNSNGARGLSINRNYIEGYLWLLSGTRDSEVVGNEIYAPASAWLGLAVPTYSIVTGNRVYADGTPIYLDGGAIMYALIADNYVARLDGSAAPLPAGGATNTMRDNWTAGQVP